MGACFFMWSCLWGQVTIRLDSLDGKLVLVAGPVDTNDRPGEGPPAEAFLRVFVGEEPPEAGSDRPAMAGELHVEDDRMIFRPAIPFRPGLRYWALVEGSEPLSFVPTPSLRAENARVTAIFPSRDTLPANQLKFYLQFNRPMAEGHAYDFVRLIREDGKEVVEPFVPLQPELWDLDRRRLTLWLNPGRVKRDLGPNQALGAILVPGSKYTLEVMAGWPVARGGTLGETRSKTFFVAPADREKPDVESWVIEPPAAGTRQALRIVFGESLDAVLAQRAISLWFDYEPVKGEVSLLEKEAGWSFIPETNWEAGTYRIRVESRLEDLASNNLVRLFDRDLEQPEPGEEVQSAIRVFTLE